MKASRKIFELQQFIDNQWRRLALNAAAQGGPITCRGLGCNACCYEPVYASREEVEHLLARLTPEAREGVKDRLIPWLAKVEPSHLLDQDLPNVFEWRKLHALCPFNVNGACMVYHDRPVSCRMHSASGNPDDCFDDEKRKHQKFLTSPELFEHFAMYCAANFKKVENANLGTWLAEILLHKKIEDGTGQVLQFTHEKPKPYPGPELGLAQKV